MNIKIIKISTPNGLQLKRQDIILIDNSYIKVKKTKLLLLKLLYWS